MNLLKKIIPFAVFVTGIWYFCVRILGYGFEYIPGDFGDSRFINYLLEHGYRWISGKDPEFWSAGFMFPFKNTMALSDSMLGTIPFYAVWRWIGFNPETSYQLWWICICTLNFWISFFIFKKWFSRSDLAAILAWIFAFTIYNLGHLNYMQMIGRFMVPVVFYAAYKMIDSPSVKYLAIYCFGIIFQFYSVMYTGFYLLYFSLLFIFIYITLSKKWKETTGFYFSKDRLLYVFIIFSVSFAGMLLLFFPYFKMSKIIGFVPYHEIQPNIPLLSSYLFPHESSFTWRFLHNSFKPQTPIWWLHYMFPGMILFGVLVLSPVYLFFVRKRKNKIPFYIISLIVSSVLILLLHLKTAKGISLYPLFFKFPGVNSMRVLTRFMNVEIFILLVLLGFFLVKLKSRYLFLVFISVFLDNLFKPGLLPKERKTEVISRREILMKSMEQLDYKKYKAVALIDTTQIPYITNLDIMIASQLEGAKTINGYSSYVPVEFEEFSYLNSEKGLEQWLLKQNIRKEEILLLKK